MKSLGQLLPLVLIGLVFWFLILRPNRKRAANLAAVQSRLQPGTKVMLNSGIFGTVESLDDEAISLAVAPGTTVRVHRQAIARLVEPIQASTDDALPPDATSL